MSYTQSFVGETEFDRQALNLDPGQSGVPLWKVYDPRSERMPSDLRYDLSGLGDLGKSKGYVGRPGPSRRWSSNAGRTQRRRAMMSLNPRDRARAMALGDLSGLGGSPAWSDPKPTAVAEAKMALAQAQAELNLNPTNGQLVAKVVARADELRAVLEKKSTSTTSSDPKAQSDDSGGLPKWALPVAIAAAVAVAGYLFL